MHYGKGDPRNAVALVIGIKQEKPMMGGGEYSHMEDYDKMYEEAAMMAYKYMEKKDEMGFVRSLKDAITVCMKKYYEEMENEEGGY